MKEIFKVSTNIERDSNLDLDYIVTKNTNEVYNRITFNHSRGQNSFSVIGSYGTGKSSFLWAIQKHLEGKVIFDKPVNGEFKGINKFDFIRIVGEGVSFKDQFCQSIGIANVYQSNKLILKEFDAFYSKISSKNFGLVILVDEFGKHLEYIAKNNPDEMYFIQELAEYCNNIDKNILFITTLHQNMSSYSKGMTISQKSEWDKIKGRLLDISFDEPVEQLLFFAAQKLKKHQIPNDFEVDFKNGISKIVKSNLLGKSSVDKEDLFLSLFPLDPLSSDILTKSLQRYGQNERSLFTFLNSPELQEKISDNEIFSVQDCFDYLTNNLASEIEDGEKNPFKSQWKAAVGAIEKCEFLFDKDYSCANRLVKTICLVNIFSNSSGVLDEKFLVYYAETYMNLNNVKSVLKTLQKNNIIKFSNHRNKFNFTEGTDIDIEYELINSAKHIDNDINLINRLEAYFDFGYVPAKRFQYETGTPRLFNYKFYDSFEYEEPFNEIDGFINLIFTKKKITTLIKNETKDLNKSQIFVVFNDVEKIEDTIFEIDKINFVINKFSEDKVAIKLLNEEKLFRIKQLENFVHGSMFSDKNNITWIYNGKDIKVKSTKDLNQLLSNICDEIFHKTPVFRNEMVNKEFLSTPILTARKALIKKIIDQGDIENLGFDKLKFPPEKTIYLSFLKETGIHSFENNVWSFGKPKELSFIPLWEETERVLAISINSKTFISDIYKALKENPFKLKQGFLDYWIPIFLIIKKEDYALYSSGNEYIPHLTSDILDLIHKNPSKYIIKGLSNEGVNMSFFDSYKKMVDYNQSNIKGLKTSYITIYSNFLKFYRGLDDYSKKTRTIPKSAQGVRDAIAKAKDPESALFDTIPNALGYNHVGITNQSKKVDNFLNDLKDTIKQIRKAYDDLIEVVEKTVLEHLKIKESKFKSYQTLIHKKYSGVNKNLIANDKIKVFYSRAISPIDDRRAYWESLSESVLGKKLEKISDDEINLLLERLKGNFEDLTNLIDIHKIDVSEDEKVIQLNITHGDGNNNFKKNIIISNNSKKDANDLQSKLELLLGGNSTINKIALLNLLEKELNKK